MTVDEKRKPWLKWYPSDWRAEPRLRLVSRAARSVWLDMLGLMHESTLIGYLLVNGKKPTPDQLARILGDDIRDLSGWLEELAAAGVYSETDDGVVFSRRMVRDHERAEKGRKDVEKRWGPKRKPKGESDRPPNRVPTQEIVAEPSTQRPEARGQKDLNPTRGFKSSGVASGLCRTAGARARLGRRRSALGRVQAFHAAQRVVGLVQRLPPRHKPERDHSPWRVRRAGVG